MTWKEDQWPKDVEAYHRMYNRLKMIANMEGHKVIKQREEKRAQDEKVEQEKRLQREAEVQRRKAEAQRRTQNRALWSRKKEGMRTIAESVFPKIVSFEYDPYIDRLEIETNEQELHYDDVLTFLSFRLLAIDS